MNLKGRMFLPSIMYLLTFWNAFMWVEYYELKGAYISIWLCPRHDPFKSGFRFQMNAKEDMSMTGMFSILSPY